jgi:O-antigen/teichoic acid export membrane protein
MTDERSFASNCIKIYVWQCLSIITSFLSMFIVVPHVSSSHSLFGIYSICMSTVIFVSYADFGFMSSGFRYASESFARNDLRKEVQTVGFISFILFAFVMLFAVAISAVALYPQMLIANLTDPSETAVASALLAWLAVFSPIIVVQRMLQIIYGVRVEDYIYQRVNIAGNLVKILSVFLFINASGYDIVGYFVTCQLISAMCAAISLRVAKARYHYDLGLLLRSFRFNRDIFDATRHLAFSSMYVTLAWVLYYELDTLFLGKTLGADKLAVYAVALGLVSFFRSLSSTIFLPFRARMQHLAALNDDDELRGFYRRVIVVTLPVVVFPALSLFMLMKPFMFSWVGAEYASSVLIAQLLILVYVDGFNSVPASYLLVAKERVRDLYLIGSMSPLVLWGGVLLTIQALDVTTFGTLKLLATVPSQVFSMVISIRYLRVSGSEFLREVVGPGVLPSVSLMAVLWYLSYFMPMEKSQLNVAVVIATGGAASLLALVVYYWGSTAFREELSSLLRQRSFWQGPPIVSAA